MKSYPILFRFREPIMGRGFVAFVAADGRAVLTEDEEGCWFYGVNPGGIAGGGDSRAEAFREFQTHYLSVVFEIASLAPSFDEFRAETERFFSEVNQPAQADWIAAHSAVRSGDLDHPDLKRVKADERPLALAVIRVGDEPASQRPEPSLNQFDELAVAEAA
jgi:hypothetical protein